MVRFAVLPIIPPRRHRQRPILYDTGSYMSWATIGCLLNSTKRSHRFVTGDEPRRQTLPTFVPLTSLRMMRQFISRA